VRNITWAGLSITKGNPFSPLKKSRVPVREYREPVTIKFLKKNKMGKKKRRICYFGMVSSSHSCFFFFFSFYSFPFFNSPLNEKGQSYKRAASAVSDVYIYSGFSFRPCVKYTLFIYPFNASEIYVFKSFLTVCSLSTEELHFNIK
jgi:hypothetical protein